MKIITTTIDFYITGKNKYNPINVMPTTASESFTNQIFDTFIELDRQAVV